jgi:ribosomal protein S18 acetylase RimI-like enzyme
MEIRELREGDGRGLSRLIADVQAEVPEAMTFGILAPERIRETVEWKLGAVREGAMADFVAVDGEEVVADCEILCEGREGTVGLLVAKGHRGRGVGGRLLEKCIARARDLGVRAVRAKVSASNARAISFFEKSGFRRLAGPSDGVVMMSKTLL